MSGQFSLKLLRVTLEINTSIRDQYTFYSRGGDLNFTDLRVFPERRDADNQSNITK